MVINTSCCTWTNVMGQIDINIKEKHAQADWFHSFGRGDITSSLWSTESPPKLTWFLPFLSPLIVAPSGPCLFNLLVRLVSSRFQQLQESFMMAQGIQPIPAEGGSGPYRFLAVSEGLLHL